MIVDLFDAMVAATVAASTAILGVLALRAIVRRRFGAEAAYLLWSAVLLAVIATQLPGPVISAAMFAHSTPASSIVATLAAPVAAASYDPRLLLLALWIAGALGMAALLAFQQRRYVRSLGQLKTFDDVRVLRADATVGCPALVGALRPRIVLPADFERRYEPRERELVLAHEYAHRARGDAQANALVALVRCLNWFNPLIHLAAARFRFDQELACDASVIRRFPEARRSYADAMLKTQLAEQSRQELRLPVGCRWPSGHPLKERIHMLKNPMPTRARRALGTAVIAALALAGGYASWSMQPARAASGVADRPAAEDTTFRSVMAPRYPQTAIASRITGDVMLKVRVNEKGEPEAAEIASIDPPDANVLGDAAIATVMKWRFNPAMKDGVAVAGDVQVPIAFRISDDDSPPAPAPEPPVPPPPAPPPPPWPALPESAAHTSYHKLSPPVYPVSSVNARVEGVVYVDASIDTNGSVVEATVDHVEPPIAAVLGRAATDAVKTWRFDPPMQQGKNVAAHAIVPLRFAITDPESVKLTSIPAGALDIVDIVAKPPRSEPAS